MFLHNFGLKLVLKFLLMTSVSYNRLNPYVKSYNKGLIREGGGGGPSSSCILAILHYLPVCPCYVVSEICLLFTSNLSSYYTNSKVITLPRSGVWSVDPG